MAEGEVANVHTVEQHLALLHIVKAQQEIGQGGLAGAGVTDDRHRLARVNGQQGDVFNYAVVAQIGEADVTKFDHGCLGFGIRGLGLRADSGAGGNS